MIFLGRLFSLLLIILSGASSLLAQSSSKDLAKELDTSFSGIATADTPGFAVMVKKDGNVVFEKGYGVRDLRTKTAIDAQTNFRLASFTKQFTAMAIMLLVHDGKLRYDQTLTQIFPEFPVYGKTISVRNLLNHTGGLSDYEDLMDALEKVKGPIWSPEKQIQDSEVLQLLEKESQGKFAPGTKWEYSNSGYVVLGLIVAKVSGKSFAEFLHERIFSPLKMDQTVAYEKGKNEVANRAFGHSRDSSSWKQTDQSSTSATLGDGGVYSSVRDLAKWDEALAKHTLLSEIEMRPALTPATLLGGEKPVWPAGQDRTAGTPVAYGFGWFLNPYRGHPRMWHYGETMGFHTYIERFGASASESGQPDQNSMSIVVLCNRTDLDPEALAAKVADLYFAKP